MILIRWWKSLSRVERPFWVFGFLMHVLAFFYCTGYQHGDEHFQILEFAGYKLNLCTYDSLAWEYPAQMRPGFQPFIAFCFGKISLLLFGEIRPFWISDALRIVSILIGILSMIALRSLAKNLFHDVNKINLVSFILNFLWFLPFLHARFSSENWSGVFMVFGVYYLFRQGRDLRNVTNKSIFISGIFWGLAFESRYQIGLAAFALSVWILVYQTKQIKSILFLILGGLSIVFISGFIDYWLYQKLTFPPLNYLRETLLKSVDMFGVSPWYDYVIQSQNWFGFPFGILAIGLFILILIKLRKSPFAWIFISFIVFHSFIGHKEIRFLFPVFYLIPILIAELIPEKWLVKQNDFYQETFKNALMLILILSAIVKSVFTSISYASPDLNTFRTLNKIAEKTEKITVFCPYNIGYVMAHYYEFRFFRNDKINLRFYTNNTQLMAQNPHKENEYVLVWDHFTHWPAERGMMMVYNSITSIQKSFIYRGSSWNRDEYTIYKAKN